jgi:hypothetical protein
MFTIETQTVEPTPAEPWIPPFSRMVAVFARPGEAWSGLHQRAQWWYPLILSIALFVAGGALLHNRAVVPMMRAAWDEQIANGQLTPQQAEQAETFMTGPVGIAFSVVNPLITVPLLTLLFALAVWFGAGFVLGTKFSFRQAFEVTSWAGLVQIPGYLLTLALAWSRESFKGVHIGFGVLLPETDTPGKLQVALGVLLDALGPLSLWYLAVVILGAAVLSGAPRRRVMWVLGGLYLVLYIFGAAIAAAVAPGA